VVPTIQIPDLTTDFFKQMLFIHLAALAASMQMTTTVTTTRTDVVVTRHHSTHLPAALPRPSCPPAARGRRCSS
jgi:multidrug efflux pump subunit AcrB